MERAVLRLIGMAISSFIITTFAFVVISPMDQITYPFLQLSFAAFRNRAVFPENPFATKLLAVLLVFMPS